MDQFWLYFTYGLNHILDWDSHDHLLLFVVLLAAHPLREWSRILWLLGLFTIGCVMAMILVVYDVVSVDRNWVEFLIPITILAVALHTIFSGRKRIRNEKNNLFFFGVLFVGLIHGLEISAYFNEVANGGGGKLLLLFEFILGIGVAQVIVVFLVLVLSIVFQSVFRFSNRDWILMISALVAGLTVPILVENWLW